MMPRLDLASQPRLRVVHDGKPALVQPNLYDLRRSIGLAVPDWPAEHISVGRGRCSLFVTALTPQGAAWIDEHMPRLLQALARMDQGSGEPLVVVPEADVPGLDSSAEPGAGWLYRIGSLVVASKRQDWSPWEDEALQAAQRLVLGELIVQGLRQSLSTWHPGRAADPNGWPGVDGSSLCLLNEGRPMRITPERGPRGMARLDVSFVARWRLEGEFHVGGMRQQGYGRLELLGRTSWPSQEQAYTHPLASGGTQ